MPSSVLIATEDAVFVIGLGLSGISVCHYLIRQGLEVYAVDDDPKKVEKAKETFQGKAVQFFHPLEITAIFPLIREKLKYAVVSPGIPPTNPLYQLVKESCVEVIGEAELGCRSLGCSAKAMIGITGTNGKTTVALLIHHILIASGKLSLTIGNIGKPIVDLLPQEAQDQVLVVELSSFQLETMTSRVLDQAILLNLTADHLDRYSSLKEYALVKFQIARCLKEKGRLFVFESVVPLLAESDIKLDMVSPYGFSSSSHICLDGDWVVRLGQKEVRLPLLLQQKRNHDVENFLAAYAVCRELNITGSCIVEAYDSFKKPPHRIEFITTINGVQFWNDSKGTNLDAVIKAVKSVPGPIQLIAGGVHKGENYQCWLPCFKGKVAHIFAIGQAASLIEKDLSGDVAVKLCKDLEEAVWCANKVAKPGDSILLSPGCSSYDMFRDYKERGEKFKQLVLSL